MIHVCRFAFLVGSEQVSGYLYFHYVLVYYNADEGIVVGCATTEKVRSRQSAKHSLTSDDCV